MQSYFLGLLTLGLGSTLYACGRGSSDYLADSGSDETPQSTLDSGSPATGAIATVSTTSVAPTPPALQSSVPPDGPCTVPAGQVTQIFADSVSVAAIDRDFLYVTTPYSMFQIALSNNASRGLGGVDAGPGMEGDFILGDGAILYVRPDDTLGKWLVPNDATNGPSGMALSSTPYPGLASDGLNVYMIDHSSGAAAFEQIPIDGSKPITTPVPAKNIVFEDLATPHGLYVAMGTTATTTSLSLLARDTGQITQILANFGPNPMAADDSYIYYLDGSGGVLPHDIYRVGLDGSNPTKLATTDSAFYIAVDAHDVYVSTGSQIAKVDKTNGGTLTKLADAIAFEPLFVMGGNVYFYQTDSQQAIAPGVYTVCK